MSTNTLKDINLNILPVTTWRWLKVNEFQLKNFKLNKITNYSGEFIKSAPIADVYIDSLKDNFRYFEFQKTFKTMNRTGVSEEFTSLAETNSNAESFISVGKGIKTASPVVLSFQGSEENPSIIDHTLIVTEENSEITVIMDYSSTDSTAVFHNGLTKVHAGDGSVVNLIKVQTFNDSSFNVDSVISVVGYGAKVNYISVELGSEKSFSSYITNLDKDTAQADLKSIYLTDGKRYTDLSYIMNMVGRRTQSSISTHGALKDKAKKVFKGTLDFKKGCTHSKASEEEYATLLDKTVKADAVPLLLCGEEDVEGTHAASAGRIDEEKLFYLRSRGFSEMEAKKLIIESYFRPVIDLIPVEGLKEKIQSIIDAKLVKEG